MRQIGEGVSGTIEGDGIIAVKRIKFVLAHDAITEYILSKRAACDYVIDYTRFEIADDHVALYMTEYEDSLQSAHTKKWMSARRGIMFMGCILKGLDHIHSSKIIHCDIAPQNILIRGDAAVICDFGLSEIAYGLSSMYVQRANYRAPEVDASVLRARITPAIDMWSAGCIAYWLETRQDYNPYRPPIEDTSVTLSQMYGKFSPIRQTRLDRLAEIPELARRSTLAAMTNKILGEIAFHCLDPRAETRIRAADAAKIIDPAYSPAVRQPLTNHGRVGVVDDITLPPGIIDRIAESCDEAASIYISLALMGFSGEVQFIAAEISHDNMIRILTAVRDHHTAWL